MTGEPPVTPLLLPCRRIGRHRAVDLRSVVMNRQQPETVSGPGTGTALIHPDWCDPTLCTADPAATRLVGYRAGAGGEHRSTPIPLDLRAALWPPTQNATAYLTEAVAPWKCSTFLRVRAGDTELSLPVDYAEPVLTALSALTTSARVAVVDR